MRLALPASRPVPRPDTLVVLIVRALLASHARPFASGRSVDLSRLHRSRTTRLHHGAAVRVPTLLGRNCELRRTREHLTTASSRRENPARPSTARRSELYRLALRRDFDPRGTPAFVARQSRNGGRVLPRVERLTATCPGTLEDRRRGSDGHDRVVTVECEPVLHPFDDCPAVGACFEQADR